MFNIYSYVIIGFFAQLIDGSMGMAYGISCSTFLKNCSSIPIKVISGIVHCAEVPTTFFAGLAHYNMKNIDKSLFTRLVLVGTIGTLTGALILSRSGELLRPIVDIYLIFVGVLLLKQTFIQKKVNTQSKSILTIGFLGGMFDAIGGGGWGPMVTPSLLLKGYSPKTVIGTVTATEFFVSFVQVGAYAVLQPDLLREMEVVLGLIIGGICAAPFAAWLCGKLPERFLTFLIGGILIILNLFSMITWIR